MPHEKMNSKDFQTFDAKRKQAAGNLKYHNEWTQIDGIKFQSKTEAAYYGQLKMRYQAKDIKEFRRQVRYRLIVDGVLICVYVADFVIDENDGSKTVVDCKSEATADLPVFRMKRALMWALLKINVKVVK